MSRRSSKSEGGQKGIFKNRRNFSGGFFAHVLRDFHEIGPNRDTCRSLRNCTCATGRDTPRPVRPQNDRFV